MTAPFIIRPATQADQPKLRQAIVELQDYERLWHATRLPSEQVADSYLDWMQRQAETQGAVLVAERGGRFTGFVAGWIEQTQNISETPDSNRFGYISDICVLPAFRGQRIATQLLDGIEQYLRRVGVTRLRITTLAANTSAQASYEHAGFLPYEILYEKVVDAEASSNIVRPPTSPDESLARVRQWFAEELRFVSNLGSRGLVDAFATVPRERFVGPGPWRIRSPMDRAQYWTTNDADPRHVYHDALIALDETRALNNGQPSLWALLFDQLNPSRGTHVLHLGCGTGYYSAILAELVGPQGKVTALEIDEKLAERARIALGLWPQVTVVAADGASYVPGAVDAIVASAGATHPLPIWLDGLKPDGRLLLPLTAEDRGGAMLLATRLEADAFAARLVCPVGFIEFTGARDPEAQRRLKAALGQGNMHAVRSLRRDMHAEHETCWLHNDGWCLSRRDPSLQGAAAA
jgi:protein-L-isoaspartate(D-aspartate) O-methyltransferase